MGQVEVLGGGGWGAYDHTHAELRSEDVHPRELKCYYTQHNYILH